MIACDTIYRDSKCQTIRYTEMGIIGRRYDIQRWEVMAADMLEKDVN